MPSYRAQYAQFREEVDAAMGRTRGRWARFKTFFLRNSFGPERKAAIDRAVKWNELKARIEANAAKLYRTHNIIGSTGSPGQRPSVYYRSNSGTFGHITQFHALAENVGREVPRRHAQYTLANTGPKGALEERVRAEVIHLSRHPFVSVRSDEEREALSHAHRHFPKIKEESLKRAREQKVLYLAP